MEMSDSWTGVHFKKNAKHKTPEHEVVHYRPHAKRGRPPLKNLIENKGYGETAYYQPRSKSPGSVAANESTSYYKRKKYKAPAPPPNGHIPNGSPFVRQNSFRSVQTFSTTDSALKAKKRRAPPPPPMIPEGPPPGALTRRVSDESLDMETHSVHTISADVHNESGDIDAELDDVVATIERTRKEIDDLQKENDSGISSNDSAFTMSLARKDLTQIGRQNTKVQNDINTLDIVVPPIPKAPPPPLYPPPRVSLPPSLDADLPLTSGTTSMTNTLQTDPGSMLTDITAIQDNSIATESQQDISVIPKAPLILLPMKPAEMKSAKTDEVKEQIKSELLNIKLKRITSMNKAAIPITKFDLFKSELARAAMERSQKGHVEPPPKLPYHLQLQEELSKAVKAREARKKGGTVRMRRLRSQTTIFAAKKSDSDSLSTTPRDNTSQPASPRDQISQSASPCDKNRSEQNTPRENPNQTMYPALEKPVKGELHEKLEEDNVFNENNKTEDPMMENEENNVVLLSQKSLNMDSDTSTQSQSVYLGTEPEEEGWTPQVDLTDDDDSTEEREMITARGNTSIPKSFHMFSESPTVQKKKKTKKGNLLNIRKSVKNAIGSIGRAVHRRKKIDAMLDENWEIYQAEEFDEIPAGIVNVDHIEKRPAYAYHPGKGELVLLPEYETVIVTKDGKRIQESALRNRRQTKDKKYSYQKTERRKEKQRLDRELSKAINAREILFDEERAKHLEMERRFLEGRAKKLPEDTLSGRQRQQMNNTALPPIKHYSDHQTDYQNMTNSLEAQQLYSSRSQTDPEDGDVDSPLPPESDHKTESETNPVSSRLEDSGFTDAFSLSTGTGSQHSPQMGSYKPMVSSPPVPHGYVHMNGGMHHSPMVLQNGISTTQGIHHGFLQPQVGLIHGNGSYMGYQMDMQNVTMATPPVAMQPMNYVPMVQMPTIVSQPNNGYIVAPPATNGPINPEFNVAQIPTQSTDTNNNNYQKAESNEEQSQKTETIHPIVPPLDLSSITKDENNESKDDNPDDVTNIPPSIPVAPPPPPVPLTEDVATNSLPKGFVRQQVGKDTSTNSSPRSVLDSSVGLPSFYKKPSGYRPVKFNANQL